MKCSIHIPLTSCLMLCSTPVFSQATVISMEDIQIQLERLSAQVETLSSIVEEQNKIIQQQDAELKAQKAKSIQEIEIIIGKEIQHYIEKADSQIDRHAGNINISHSPASKPKVADDNFSLQPFGRVHLDATFFDGDESSDQNYTDLRRGRFGLRGALGEDLTYLSEVDFAEDEADIQDMTLTYTGLENMNITMGHHRPPVSFQRNTSSNHHMFIERAASTNLFAANRKIGLSMTTKAQDYVAAVGVFNDKIKSGNDGEHEEDLSIDVRTATNLLGVLDIDPDNVLHIGLGYSHQKPSEAIRFRASPSIGDDSRILDTGNIDNVDTVRIINAEFVGVFDAFSIQSEYFDSVVSRHGTNANFSGYYVQAGYFLTGEERNYNRTSGLFGRTHVLEDFNLNDGSIGAWEVLARFDHTDLNDHGAGVSGGELDLYTFGLNWYLNRSVRFMGNIIVVNSENDGASITYNDPTIFKLRAQWDF